MSLIKKQKEYFPTSLNSFRSQFDNLFDNFFSDFSLDFPRSDLIETSFKPRVNICEDEKSYQIEAELPGVKKEDIEVEFANNLLTIKAERKEEKEKKDKNYHRVESFYGTFQRSVNIPNPIEEDKINAEFKDGMLQIELPKSSQEQTSKNKINIK